MYTKVSTVNELAQLFFETFLNKQDKVTKITRHSVVSGYGFATAKIGQKAIKDVANVEAHLFPDFASGLQLDQIAADRGIASRFGSAQSSTYVRLVGNPGTTYTPGTHTVDGSDGIVFDFENQVILPDVGFAYAKIRSQTLGASANVSPLTLTKVNPIPAGHRYLINEYAAIGGRDVEPDDAFRQRIKEGPNILARQTLSYLTQVFNKINNTVLRVLFQGFNDQGKTILAIVSENGIDYTQSELDELLDQGGRYLALSDLKDFEDDLYGVELVNIQYQPIDVSFNVLLDTSYDPDIIRSNIQIRMQKELDYRFWEEGSRVEWDNLLDIVKSTSGVLYVADQSFIPNQDITIDIDKLPRIRGFIMRNLEGNILANLTGTLNPTFYPTDPNLAFQSSVLTSI